MTNANRAQNGVAPGPTTRWGTARRIAVNLGIVVASFGVALGLLEVGVRIFRPQKYFAVVVNTWDRVVGTRHIPGAHGVVVCPEYRSDLVINSKGLRDREFPYAKPPGTGRILCLGDSYTCGYGVQADETYPKVLEEILSRTAAPPGRWEALNAGVGSTGTAQQLAYLQAEGYKYGPDVVLVGFCPANDFHDNVASGLFSVDNGALVQHDAPQTSMRRIQRYTSWIPSTLFEHSHLLNFIKYRASRRHARTLILKAKAAGGDTYTDFDAKALDLAERLFVSMDESCRARGARLVVMLIPTPNVPSLERSCAALVEFLGEHAIACCDLTETFAAAAGRGEQTSYLKDGHWNRAGHALAARVLGQSLAPGD